jgi:hypothetical protein
MAARIGWDVGEGSDVFPDAPRACAALDHHYAKARKQYVVAHANFVAAGLDAGLVLLRPLPDVLLTVQGAPLPARHVADDEPLILRLVHQHAGRIGTTVRSTARGLVPIAA